MPYSKLENVCTVDFEDFLIPRLFLYNFKLITDITSTYFLLVFLTVSKKLGCRMKKRFPPTKKNLM